MRSPWFGQEKLEILLQCRLKIREFEPGWPRDTPKEATRGPTETLTGKTATTHHFSLSVFYGGRIKFGKAWAEMELSLVPCTPDARDLASARRRLADRRRFAATINLLWRHGLSGFPPCFARRSDRPTRPNRVLDASVPSDRSAKISFGNIPLSVPIAR